MNTISHQRTGAPPPAPHFMIRIASVFVSRMGAQGESDALEHQVGRFSIQRFFCVLASGLFPHGFPSQVRVKLPIPILS